MSYFALDEKNKRTYIDNAHVKERYFCEICHQPLIIKRGTKIAHHFAHYPNCACKDNWHYDEMSIWHLAWQERFPLDSREIIKEYNGQLHRADVIIEKTKIEIEFQHSPITEAEFEDRNKFYSNLGYKVIWIFDCLDYYKDGNISNLGESQSKYKWLNPLRTFNSFTISNKENVTLFFQRDEDPIKLEKIVWIAPSGFERFCSDPFSLDQFMDLVYKNKTQEKEVEPTFEKGTICYISKNNKTTFFIVKNRETDDKVMIIGDPIAQFKKYHRIYGRKEDTFGDFKKESEIIEDFNRPIWRLIWKKKK